MRTQLNGDGWKRIYNATLCSFSGIRYALQNESAFRQELILALVAVPMVPFIAISWIEGVIMIAAMVLILIVECLNSAIETTIDRISPDIHELSKVAKDLGSAAVFFTLLLAAIVWGCLIVKNFLLH